MGFGFFIVAANWGCGFLSICLLIPDQVIPGEYGFIAQLNEGRHLKKRPTEFRVDKVLQPFDGNKFNFTKVGQEEVLFQFEPSNDEEPEFIPNAPIDVENSTSVVAINVCIHFCSSCSWRVMSIRS